MAISLDEYDKILEQMPDRGGTGDQLDLSEEDEAALDRAWKKVAKENKSSKVSA